MGWQRAFPYTTDNSALQCQATALDRAVMERADGTWDAFSNEPEKLRIALSIKSDIERLAKCVPEGADPRRNLELVLSLEGLQARQRRELLRLDVGAHDVEIQLDPLEYIGRVDLALSARLRMQLAPEPGFAHLKASRVAAFQLPSIWFTEPPQSIGDSLEVRWEDFDEHGDLVDGQLFAIRMEERPVILLNSAITSAYDILGSKGTWGAAARIRDAIYAQIVHQAWSSIISHCLLEIARHDENEPPETVLAELEDWQGQVLRAWAPQFIPNESDPEQAALRLIEESRVTGSLVLLHKLAEAIQEKCATISGFEGLIKESHRFEGRKA